MCNIDHKVDIFWQQRLFRKHKDLETFKSKLMICIGYYHEKTCDEIIQQLKEQKALEQFVDILWNLIIFTF